MATCFSKQNFLFRICFILAVVVTPTISEGLPSIQVPQENYAANYGESITLECTVVSNPEHTGVRWYKISDDNINSIIFLGEKYDGSTVAVPSLTIYNVEENDAGSYVCTATNANGVGESTRIYLVVNGGLPSIQVPHENYTVNYGESITVECKVVSNPEHTSINWTKLVNGNYISINFLGGKYGGSIVDMPSLTVYNIEENDAGFYVCTATNAIGIGLSPPIALVVNESTMYYLNNEYR